VVMFFPGGLVQLFGQVAKSVKAYYHKIREGIYGKDLG
jgi:hypothetical protein